MNLTKGLLYQSHFYWRYFMTHFIDSVAYIGQPPRHSLGNYPPPNAVSLYVVAGSRWL
ncbi:hypothetical protein AERO9A_300054 [Aeromonas salmonicida]|nr:hypothetical protein AERO9A_300054 [Aeromonas salmonicida]